MKVTERIIQAKSEILKDIKKGIVPNEIESFDHLHEFVDANKYGGFLEDDYIMSNGFEVENQVQNELDVWIKNKGHKL